MQAIPRSPFVRFVVVPLTLVGFLAGCTHWATVDPPWAEAIAESQPDKVRVTLADDTKLVVTSPVLARDSLTGLVEAKSVKAIQRPDGIWAASNDTTAQDQIAFQTLISNIQKVEQREVSTTKTVVLSTGLFLLLAGTVALAIVCANESYWGCGG